MTSRWHVEEDQLARYVEDRVDPAIAASVEAHLLDCASCRRALAEYSSTSDIEASWASLERRIDATIEDPAVRMGRALRLPEIDLRLVAPTNSLRLASILGGLIALAASAVLAGHGADGAVSTSRLAFLIVAPLVPLAAVVSALGLGSEPDPELAKCAPISRVRVGALRASVALAAAVGGGIVVALATRGPWTRVHLWLLPALALATSGAVATRFAPSRVVLVLLGGGWVVAVSAAARLSGDRLAAFDTGPQLAYLAVTVLAAAAIALHPTLLDLREQP